MSMLGWFLSIGGFIVGVLGVWLALWTRDHPRTDAEIRWASTHRRIAPVGKWPEDDDDISVSFAGTTVPFVDEMVFVVRNFGPGRLNADDEEQPLVIVLPEGPGRILRLRSDCAEQIDDRTVCVHLAPLHVDDIRRVEMLHSIENVTEASVAVSGQLRNVPHGVVHGTADLGQAVSKRLSKVLSPLLYPVVGVVLWAGAISYAFFSEETDHWPLFWKVVVAALGPLLIFIGFGAVLLMSWALLGWPYQRLIDHLQRRRSPFGLG